jgi:fatty acid desaturase
MEFINLLIMWNIHGKMYDLNNFMDIHPGGRTILEAIEGPDDLSATFESYHSMCDMKKIKNMMKKYEVGVCAPTNFLFDDNGFYRTVQKRVRFKLGNDTKSNWKWVLKVLLQFVIFAITFAIAFFHTQQNIFFRIICAGCAGNVFMQMQFCIMHDASHMAISKKTIINSVLSDLCNSIGLWDSKLWTKHHVFRHHTFTGNDNLDPDIDHLCIAYAHKYIVVTLFVIFIFPGHYVGQSISYHLIWLRKGVLWKMNLSTFYKISLWQTFIKLFMLFSFIQVDSWVIFFTYAIALNVTYAICVLPDHDTLETQKNKISCNKNYDWGEIQVRHSGNFCTQKSWFGALFGGINYQIEHHLFPTICHIHFYKIKPIIEQTCKEFNIPYVHHDTIFNAFMSTLKYYTMNNIKVD